MAKEANERGAVTIKANKAGLAFLWQLALMLGASAGTLGVAEMIPSKPPTEVVAAVPLNEIPAFLKLDGEVRAHHAQQDKDIITQRARDEAQDSRTQSVNAGVDMLNQGVAGIDAKVQTLQGQMAEVQRDIKELLRMQARPRNPE